MPEIRPARPDDAAEVAAIWNQIIRDTTLTFTTEEKVPAALNLDPARFLVSERYGRIIGFATFGTFRAGPGYRHTAEVSIHLHPDMRGAGVGGVLLSELETQARRAQIHVLVACIAAENAGAIRFFARHGHEESGRMAEVGHKFGRWLDLVLMQKIL